MTKWDSFERPIFLTPPWPAQAPPTPKSWNLYQKTLTVWNILGWVGLRGGGGSFTESEGAEGPESATRREARLAGARHGWQATFAVHACVDDTSDRGCAPVQILQTWEELEMVHSETHYFFEFFAFFLHLASEKMSFSAILSAPQQGIRLYIFFQDFTYARKQLSAAVFCAECRLLRNSLFARTSVRIIVQCSKVPQKNR